MSKKIEALQKQAAAIQAQIVQAELVDKNKSRTERLSASRCSACMGAVLHCGHLKFLPLHYARAANDFKTFRFTVFGVFLDGAEPLYYAAYRRLSD